jgi:Collagen triple helix repeat (20 copies)
MFSRIRKRLTYINVAMTLALVFAMSGGAYAAGKFLITSTKQISPKVLKALKGQPGLAGPQGPQGAAGPAGPQGSEGKVGTAGIEGSIGKEGPEGKGGKEGSPWTAGGALPSGKTLKGEWNATGNAAGEGNSFENSVSYALPLVVGPTTHYIRPGEGQNEAKEAAAIKEGKCKGSVEEPGAAPGNLCVFAKQEENSKTVGPFKSVLPAICVWETGENGECAISGEGTGSRFGFGILAKSEAAGPVKVTGTWAVTAK